MNDYNESGIFKNNFKDINNEVVNGLEYSHEKEFMRHAIYVTDKNNNRETFSFFEMIGELNYICNVEPKIDVPLRILEDILMSTIRSFSIGCKKILLYDIMISKCAIYAQINHNCQILLPRILIQKIHKETNNSIKDIYGLTPIQDKHMTKNGKRCISHSHLSLMNDHYKEIDEMIDYERDYLLDYPGLNTLMKHCLLRDSNDNIIEGPQHMFARVAMFYSNGNINIFKNMYDRMSKLEIMPSLDILANIGMVDWTPMSRIDVNTNLNENYHDLTNVLKDVVCAADKAKEIHLDINGINPKIFSLLDKLSETYKSFGKKTKTKYTIRMPIWNIITMKVIDKYVGKMSSNFNFLIHMNPLFFEKVKKNENWLLFDCKYSYMLSKCKGDMFNIKYDQFSNNGNYLIEINSKSLFHTILKTMIKHDNISLSYYNDNNIVDNDIKNCKIFTKNDKDNDDDNNNNNNNKPLYNYQKNDIKYIIMENVYHVKLDSCVCVEEQCYDFKKLQKIIREIILFDKLLYSPRYCSGSRIYRGPKINLNGLSDTLIKLETAYDSPDAKELNEMIYRITSNITKETQQDICSLNDNIKEEHIPLVSSYDEDISNIQGVTVSNEPFNSIIYKINPDNGFEKYLLMNKYLSKDLHESYLHKERRIIFKNNINNIYEINTIPRNICEKYELGGVISYKSRIEMAFDRQKWINGPQIINYYPWNRRDIKNNRKKSRSLVSEDMDESDSESSNEDDDDDDDNINEDINNIIQRDLQNMENFWYHIIEKDINIIMKRK